MPLVHHELCFGCGRANLFGLLADLEQREDGVVTGRCFIKQDHQGPEPGMAHEGIVTAALTEAMSFACGPTMRPSSLELAVDERLPVGRHLELEARVAVRSDDEMRASATARFEGAAIATAQAVYRRAL